MKTSEVREVLAAVLLVIVLSGVVVHITASAGQFRRSKSPYSPAGRLVPVEVRAEGPRMQLDEVEVRAEGPEHRLEMVEVVASATGPARGVMSVVEVQARRPVAEFRAIARVGSMDWQVN